MGMAEVHYLADILGRERPDVRRLLQNASLNHQNIYIIEKHMLLKLKKMGIDLSELPQFSLNLPGNMSKDGIFIGYIMFGNKIIGELIIPVESFLEHTSIFGHSGCGKSYLIKMIIPQLVKE